MFTSRHFLIAFSRYRSGAIEWTLIKAAHSNASLVNPARSLQLHQLQWLPAHSFNIKTRVIRIWVSHCWLKIRQAIICSQWNIVNSTFSVHELLVLFIDLEAGFLANSFVLKLVVKPFLFNINSVNTIKTFVNLCMMTSTTLIYVIAPSWHAASECSLLLEV